MEIAAEAGFLILVIALLALVACLSWCVMSWVVRICPLASRRFALANLLVLIGTLLLSARTDQPSFWFWFVSDTAVLAGFFFVYLGLLKLFKLSWSARSAQLTLALALLALLPLNQGSNSAWLAGLIFSAAAAILLAHAAVANFQAIKMEFSTSAALIISSPFALIALFFLVRFGLLLPDRQAITGYLSLRHPDSLPQLLFFVVLTVVINLSLVGNAFARLVSKIRSLADRDSLTGLWTRRIMQQQLLNHARSSQRHQSVFSILLIDLDYFKKINDKFGHQIGDQALLHASACFKQALRAEDWLARYGGEEFLVLLPDTGLSAASNIAERIRQQLATEPFAPAAGMALTASIGVACYQAGNNIEELIASVDRALYQAKAQGRNQVCLADCLTNNAEAS
ncbi:GGDEF domain-containing protein [Arsukibacterium sp.]|uniref:GGDEF domain-containing protein n=1 Tax=Arsukibacterium sp. TaxID=1977258 RepID=UPI001BD34065|nr:GGDEF domain-containing protein [Arsukibacterium sp.]